MALVSRVLVVGGGVGGISLAIKLAEQGISVKLIEKSADFRADGVGLGQPANSLRALRELGVYDEVIKTGFIYDHMVYLDQAGETLVKHTFSLGDEETPAVCALSRKQLLEILLARARAVGVELVLATTVTSIVNEEETVSVTFNDGSHESFDLVAGFDGVNSSIRKMAFGEHFDPPPSGVGAWRIEVPRHEQVLGMQFFQGPGHKTGLIPIAQDSMYLFHICKERPGEFFPTEQNSTNLKDRLSGYGSYIGTIRDGLSDADNENIIYSPLEPAIMPIPWNRGRVVLGGDAAHTAPPHLTSGAGMALEDAVVLAKEISRADSVEEALSRYSVKRYPRCAFVYSYSLKLLFAEQMIDGHEQYLEELKKLSDSGSDAMRVADEILNQNIFDDFEEVV